MPSRRNPSHPHLDRPCVPQAAVAADPEACSQTETVPSITHSLWWDFGIGRNRPEWAGMGRNRPVSNVTSCRNLRTHNGLN